jgi:hypothetical protein
MFFNSFGNYLKEVLTVLDLNGLKSPNYDSFLI